MQTTEAAVPGVFCGKGAFIKLARFTRKHLCHSLFFNKVAGLRPTPLLKKRLWHRCFPEFCTIFKRTFFKRNLWRTGSERRLIHTKVYYSQKKTTHKPSKVAASKNKNSSVCLLLVQPPSMNVFYSMWQLKVITFIQTYHYCVTFFKLLLHSLK